MIDSGLTILDLADQVDLARLAVGRDTDAKQRAALGQFFTPTAVARSMAALLTCDTEDVSILDPGAGAGALFAATIELLCARPKPPRTITVTACEIDKLLFPTLHQTFSLCQETCRQVGVHFTGDLIEGDFLDFALSQINPMFREHEWRYNTAILNPPYRKIQTDSRERKLLRQAGIETSNLYAGFVALALQLLQPGGELVAITPRSFCNGPYFRPFRKLLLKEAALRAFYLFEERNTAFQDDAVLQENVIMLATKGVPQPPFVEVVTAQGSSDLMPTVQALPFRELVRPDDPEHFIALVPDRIGQQVATQMHSLPDTLISLGLSVSTGRVVDFRARDYLRQQPEAQAAPLIYPTHCMGGTICWPKDGKKPNALIVCENTRDLFVPNEPYVLARRLTSKEERRRVVATLYDPAKISSPIVAFENHLNYFHRNGRGIDLVLAHGLSAYLNSSLVDSYVRQFNGHTQVNATDLRSLRYPSREQLCAIGRQIPPDADQHTIDTIIAREVFEMGQVTDPTQAQRRIQEALEILKLLGMPRQQHNERSALTLLALLDLPPEIPWSSASNPLRGITPMMEFFDKHYGRKYAPNTRETVRRQTVHQLLEAGYVIENPDKPDRPINSPKAVYQIEPNLLTALRTFGSPEWNLALSAYLGTVQTLKERYARERRQHYIVFPLAGDTTITLTPGDHNTLIMQIVRAFIPAFIPDGEVLYVGDTGDKFALFKQDELAELGITVDQHGKMPDVIIFDATRRWLFLVEAVTSHGPIDGKRRDELRRLFAKAAVGLVYVTAFLDRTTLKKYLGTIAWETEVWVAEAPTHMIHFNGDQFLGPYDEQSYGRP